MKDVSQNQDDLGFSTAQPTPSSSASWIALAVKLYSLFAKSTRSLSAPVNQGKPSGCRAERSGTGAAKEDWTGISRALEAVPHGGAKEIKATLPDLRALCMMILGQAVQMVQRAETYCE